MPTSLKVAIAQFNKENPDLINDFNNFITYLHSENPPISLYNSISICGIDTNTVLKSIEYHVSSGTFRKKTVAIRYCITIQELFLYLHRINPSEWDGKFIKELGAPIKDKNSFKRRYNDYIDHCALLGDKEPLNAISETSASELLDFCDESIDIALNCDDTLPTRISFKNMVSALCIKLMLFTGSAYRVVRGLHLSDFNETTGWMIIGGYEIILPPRMKQQYCLYKQYRIKYGIGITDDYLFCDLDGNQWGEKTSDSNMPTFLDSRMKQTDLTSISKYGIIQMMKLNINDTVLRQLTGANNGVIEHCREACGMTFWHGHLNGVLMQTNLYRQEYKKYCTNR